MSCATEHQAVVTVGGAGDWMVQSRRGLSIESGQPIELVTDGPPGVAHRSHVDATVPPARIAGDGHGRWYVVDDDGRLLVVDPCPEPADGAMDASNFGMPIGCDERVVAVAASDGLLAVAVAGQASRIEIYAVARARVAWRLIGVADIADARAMVFLPGPQLVVVTPQRLFRLDLAGVVVTSTALGLPEGGGVVGAALVWDEDLVHPAVVVTTEIDQDWRAGYRVDLVDGSSQRLRADALGSLTCERGILGISATSVSFAPAGGGRVVRFADGKYLPTFAPESVPRARDGVAIGGPLDCGRDDVRWHRVVVDAPTVDAGASWALEVAAATDQGAPIGEFVPVATDEAPDALLQIELVSRYLAYKLTLRGSGAGSPRVDAITFVAGRATSLDELPAVYRTTDPMAADFTERFLTLFDAAMADVDEVIDAAPELLNPEALPDAVLPALLIRLGYEPDPELTSARMRSLIAFIIEHRRWIGTPGTIEALCSSVFGVSAIVEELGAARPWGAVDTARVGGVRLYSRSRASFVTGASTLGVAPLRRSDDPTSAAGATGAFRISIHVRRDAGHEVSQQLMQRVILSFTPAHLSVTVRLSDRGITAGPLMRVGIDTNLVGVAVGVLGGSGSRQPRLGRTAVVGSAYRYSRTHPRRPFVVGHDKAMR